MCRNGYMSSRRIWWIRMFNHINTLPALLMNYQWSREQKWYRASIVSFLTSRKTGIAKSVWGRKLQGLLSEDVLVRSCPQRKFLVIQLPRITKSSVKDVNRDIIIDTLLWYKIWQLSGYNPTRVNQHLLRQPGETQDRIGIVQCGDSREESWTWLSQIEDMVKRCIEQNLRIKNFEARNGNYERNAVVKNQGTKTAWIKDSRRLLAMESQRAVF